MNSFAYWFTPAGDYSHNKYNEELNDAVITVTERHGWAIAPAGSDAAGEKYLGIKFNTSINVTNFAYYMYNGKPAGVSGVGNITLQGSSDNITWVNLTYLPNITISWVNVSVLNTGIYPYYRFTVYTGTSGDISITEWQFIYQLPPSLTSNSTELWLYDNYTGSIKNKSSITEQEDFYFRANYSTYEGKFINASCSFNASNITAVFHSRSSENITIADTSSRLSMKLSEGTSELINDIYRLKVCRIDQPVSVDVYINDSLYKSYASGLIPSCSATPSYYEIYEVVNAYNSTKNINISIGCHDCLNVNRQLRIVKSFNATLNYTLTYWRNFNTHAEAMYNKSSFYFYDAYPYTFFGNQSRRVTITCNGENAVFNYYPSTRQISVFITQINSIPYSDGMLIESLETTNISAAIYGDLYTKINFTVLNSSGAIQANGSDSFLIVNGSLLRWNGIYNISVAVTGYDGSITTKAGYFTLNDTVKPDIIFGYPTMNTVIQTGTEIGMNLSIYDVNLFSFNITILKEDKSILYSNYTENLTVSYFTFAHPIIFSDEGAYNLTVKAWDSHTTEFISDMPVEKTKNALNFNGITISASDAVSCDYAKLKDRYSFSFNFLSSGIKTYILASDTRLIYLPESKYKAHFVIPDKQLWVDFSGIAKEPKIERVNDYMYNIIIEQDKAQSFNSVGKMNLGEESIRFEVSNIANPYDISLIEHTNWFNFGILDFTTTSGVLMLFFLFVVYVFVVVLGYYTGISAFVLMSGVYGLFLSFLLSVGVSVIMGVTFSIVNVFILVSGVLMFRD
jgi:hypothetical protein